MPFFETTQPFGNAFKKDRTKEGKRQQLREQLIRSPAEKSHQFSKILLPQNGLCLQPNLPAIIGGEILGFGFGWQQQFRKYRK